MTKEHQEQSLITVFIKWMKLPKDISFTRLLRREVWLGTSLHMMITTVVLGRVVFLLAFTPLLGRIPLSTAILIGFALSFSSTVLPLKYWRTGVN